MNVLQLQGALNVFTRKYLDGIAPLREDGKMGQATRARIKMVKYYLGYQRPKEHGYTSDVNLAFRSRLWHPKSTRYSTTERIARGMWRRSKQRRDWRKNRKKARKTTGVGTFDGRPVANWLLPYLEWARAEGWDGTLNSGWRDPNYSERLCYNMCGRPSCPGRCAGKASNHSGSVKPRGAVDVSYYYEFGQLMKRCPYSPRIFNALGARDPVHFSASGN